MPYEGVSKNTSLDPVAKEHARKEQYKNEIRERFLTDDDFAKQKFMELFGDEIFTPTSIDSETDTEAVSIELARVHQVFFSGRINPNGVDVPKFKVLRRFIDLLQGRLVIDSGVDADKEPKELVYFPQSYEQAFDEGEIKSTHFHFLPSELIPRSSFEQIDLENDEGKTGSFEVMEIEFIAALFHPDYGNAFRDRKGRLMVKDPDTGKYQKLTYKYMESLGFSSKLFNKGNAKNEFAPRSIWEGIQARMPHVISEGLLQEGDIAEMARRSNEEFKSNTKEIIGVGDATFNNVKHHVGREYNKQNRPGMKAKSISPQRALLLDEEGVMEAFFKIFKPGDQEVKPGKNGWTGNTAPKRAIELQKIDWSGIVPERDESKETELEYDGRVASIKKGVTDFYTKVLPGLEVANEFVDRMNDSETTGLSSVAYWLAKQDKTEALRQFGKQFGAHGLRSFVRLGTKESSADQILEFAKEQPVVAEKLFAAHAALLDIANQAESILHEQVDCGAYNCSELVVTVRNNVFGQAEALLFGALSQKNPESVLAQLEQFSSDAKLYVSLLRTVGVERLLVNPLEHAPATELTEQMRQEMSQIQEENYNRLYPKPEQKQFKEKVFASLRNSFDQKNTEFYYLQHDEKIVSFNRFDWFLDEVDGRQMVYFGSFNADQTYRGVGGILLEHALQDQLERADVMMAHCDPHMDIGKKYIESGFVAKNIEDFEGEPTFEIWRTKDIASMLKTKQMDIESLVDATTGEQDGFIVREVHTNDSFPELEPDSHFLLTRYFTYGSKSYAAFEVPSAGLWNLLRPAQRGRAQEAA